MRFRSEMHDAGALELLKETGHESLVRDVPFEEVKAWVLVRTGKVLQASGVGEFVEDYQFLEIVALQEQAGETGADEASASGKKDRSKRAHPKVLQDNLFCGNETFTEMWE